MKKKSTNYFILITLACLFAAPGVTAYLFYTHPTWLSASKVNKGTLLTSPLHLASIEGRDKWRIVFWSPKTCGKHCLSQLDMLARVRLALGRKFYLVDQILITDKDNNEFNARVNRNIKATDFKRAVVSATDRQQLSHIANKPYIFIMNPDNYMVLSYQIGTKPEDVYKDLKLLLNSTEIKKG